MPKWHDDANKYITSWLRAEQWQVWLPTRHTGEVTRSVCRGSKEGLHCQALFWLFAATGIVLDSIVEAEHAVALDITEPAGVRACSAVAPVNPSSRQQGSSLSSTTCELLLQCGSSTAKKKLPKTVTVAALKLLCSRLFKLAPNQIQLQLLQSQDGPCVTTQDPTSSQELQPEDIGQDETKQLSFWDVADGSTVLITHVHPEQQRQQREAEQLQKMREHDDRMAQQLQQGEVLRTAADSN